MASPKIPWARLWIRLCKLIPEPDPNGRLLVALDDFINPKTGKKIFGCANLFDHAAKQNQSKYPWAQNVVTIGFLKTINGRWACFAFESQIFTILKGYQRKTAPSTMAKMLYSRASMNKPLICSVIWPASSLSPISWW